MALYAFLRFAFATPPVARHDVSRRRKQSGVACLEFALCMPFLTTLLLGSIELSRFELVNQKLDKVATTVADLVGQSSTASTSELSNLMLAAAQVMQPYTFSSNGYVIITSVTQTGTYSVNNPPTVNWQYTGGGTMTETSQIGVVGGAATLPAGLVLNDKDNVIVAEAFYLFTPLINATVISNQQLYSTAIYKPRLGALNTLING